MRGTVATLTLLAACVGTSLAIQCFVCNSATDSACNDELSSDSPALQAAFLQDCPEAEAEAEAEAGADNSTVPFCRKVKEYIHDKKQTRVRVHRECGYKLRKGYDCYQKRSEDYVMDVCQCHKDQCNHGPATAAPLLLPVLALPLLAKLM